VYTVLEDGTVLGSVTAFDGSYALTIPGPTRDVELIATYVGYQPAGGVVSTAAGRVDLELQPVAYDIPEVEIFGDAPGRGPGWAGLGLLGLLLLFLAVDE
jgi:hypothetical protein